MLETSARLLRVLALLQSRGYWAGAELAAQLEVTPRTLRRDINRLRDLGYVIESSTGAAGGYRLGRGASFPPLLLADDEAMAVGISLRTACANGVTGMEEAGVAALAKFEHVLPERLRRRLNAVSSAVTPVVWPQPGVDARAIATLASACQDRETLRFRYRSRDGSEESRRVEPHQLVHTGHRWYLVAWDLAREDWRTFRVDRIQAPIAAAGRFSPRPTPEGGFTAYVSRSVAYSPWQFRARVLLHCAATTASERIPPTAGIVEPVAENRCVLATGAHSPDVLCIFLALTGVDFEVLEPPELVARLEEMRERFGRAIALSEAANSTQRLGDTETERRTS